MSQITAYTCVICPIGTTVELYETRRPKIGETFDIRHIDAKKVVQRARVKSVEKQAPGRRYFRVLAEIIEDVKR